MSLPISNIIYACVELLLMAVILFGNILTITAVVKFYHLQTNTNKFVVSLAASDIMVGLVLVYHSMLYFMPSLKSNKAACLFMNCLISMPCSTSILNLAMISVDRFIAIVYPLRYPVIMTNRRITIFTLIPWICSTLLTFTLFYWNVWDITRPGCRFINIVPEEFMYVFIVTQFFAPMIVIITLYLLIFREVYRVTKRQVHLRLPVPDEKHHQLTPVMKEAKAAKTLSIIVGLFLFCWTPIFMYILIINENRDSSIAVVYKIVLFLALFNSCMNPVVYGWRNNEFRKAFKIILHIQKQSHNEVGAP